MSLFEALFITSVDAFFLILIAVIGITVSFEDIKFGRVRNKFIVKGLIAGLIGYLLLLAFALLSHRLKIIYFRDAFRNICVSWLIAYFIWYAGLWSAGDAKLFMLFSFLLPLEYYGDHNPIFFFPSFILLVNAFIFVLAFVLVETIIRVIMLLPSYISDFHKHRQALSERIAALKNGAAGKPKMTKSEFMKVAAAYLSIFLAMNIAMMYMNYFKAELFKVFPTLVAFKDISFILLIVLFRPFSSYIRKVKAGTLYLISAGLVIYTLLLLALYSKAYLTQLTRMFLSFTGFMLFIIIFTQVIEMYIEKKEEIKVDAKNVVPGQRLTRESAGRLNTYLKEQGGAEKFYSDGLTQEQVGLLQEAASKKPEFAQMSIYRSFPLAPFIFLGIAVTVIKKGVIYDFHSFKAVLNVIVGRLL
jgi:hypothetical protein